MATAAWYDEDMAYANSEAVTSSTGQFGANSGPATGRERSRSRSRRCRHSRTSSWYSSYVSTASSDSSETSGRDRRELARVCLDIRWFKFRHEGEVPGPIERVGAGSTCSMCPYFITPNGGIVPLIVDQCIPSLVVDAVPAVAATDEPSPAEHDRKAESTDAITQMAAAIEVTDSCVTSACAGQTVAGSSSQVTNKVSEGCCAGKPVRRP